MVERFGRLIIRFRWWVLAALVVVTGVFAWQIKNVSVTSETIDLFPSNHPYVETYVKYSEIFGGANTAAIAIEVREGDIFNVETLEKISRITRAVEMIPGVNNYQVLSIAQRKVKNITVDFSAAGPEFKAEPIMWPDAPKTQEEIDTLKEIVYTTPRIFGALVSKDSKAALVVAGFLEKDLDPLTIHAEVQKLVQAEEDENHQIFAIGRPIMLGTIVGQYPDLVWIFFATVAAIILTLMLYFRSVRGVFMPLGTAVLSAIWGLGFIGFLGYNFDPLVIVVPFIISARALSHSVQLMERFGEEFLQRRDQKEAAVATFAGLFKPGTLAIVTDALGVLLVMVTPIPLMQKLAVMGGFWVMSFLVSDLIFNPVLLSILPPPPVKKRDEEDSLLTRFLWQVGGACVGRGRWGILAATVLIGVVGFIFASKLVVGDVHPGTPMLWPDSKYNTDTAQIAEKFSNTEIMNIIVEGKSCPLPPREELLEQHGCDDMGKTCYDDSEMSCTTHDDCFGCDPAKGWCKTDHGRQCKEDADCISRDCNPIKSPRVLATMELFEREMATLPEVGSSLSMASLIPGVESAMHGQDPKWEMIPGDNFGAGFLVEQIISKSEPGDLGAYMTPDYQRATISLYLKDHKGDTLRTVVAKAKAFIEAHPIEEAEFLLASGYGGLLAAVNEVITMSEARVTALAFLAVLLCCILAYRSFLAGFLFLIPLAVSNYVTYAAMGALGIGLDVNALPVVALGVGLGVDYGLYIVSRIQEEYQLKPDLEYAIRRAVSTAGKAVLFTATTMIAGIVFWAFSYLKFQADMGILLAAWMTIAMLGGLILLPALIYLIKPKFVTRGITVG